MGPGKAQDPEAARQSLRLQVSVSAGAAQEMPATRRQMGVGILATFV
jgi:hypothetical protein